MMQWKKSNIKTRENNKFMGTEKHKDSPIVQKSYVILDDHLTLNDLLSGQTKSDFRIDTIVTGTIVEKRQDGVLVDIGLKAEGFIPCTEFKNWEEVKVGDQIDVYLEELENEQNQPGISLRKANFIKTWNEFISHHDEGGVIRGRMKKKVKGGVLVDLDGMEAFLPGSQIDIGPVRNIDDLIGKEYDFKILKINQERRNIVVSRRALMEEDDKNMRLKSRTEGEDGNHMTPTENLWDLVEETQNAILRRYPDRDSIAQKMALKKLESIAGSSKSPEQKFEEIYASFPFVRPTGAPNAADAQSGSAPETRDDPPRHSEVPRVRGDTSAGRLQGTVVQLKCGYGFIEPEKGDHDYFFLWEYLENCSFEELEIGEKVEFEVGTNDRGECAVRIMKLSIDDSAGETGQETPDSAGEDVFRFFASCRTAARQGNAAAQRTLGICYMYGDDVEQNSREAVFWYGKAAKQGNADAQWRLGVCFENGEGTGQNYDTAVTWYRKAAERGVADAQFRLAQCFKRGNGTKKDLNEAAKWYREAAGQGHPQAQNSLGVCYYNGAGVIQDFAEAMKWYRMAAEQEYDKAQFNLGICFYYGKGCEQNKKEAVKWYRLAAEQGYAEAQFRLGTVCGDSDTTEEGSADALNWYRLAAEQGHAEAQFRLGISYEEGDHVNQDSREAVKWYRLAAEQGHAEAQWRLGACYDRGDGIEQNSEASATWYRKSAEQGNRNAQYNLGNCYYDGEGVIRNYTEAVKWFRAAADQGDVDAYNNLGTCYYEGKGVKQDFKEAVKWYRMAAEQGDADAQDNLGGCYYEGKGIEQDFKEAVKWYRMAAEQGDAAAQFHLGGCFAEGKGVERNSAEAMRWLNKAAEQGYEGNEADE